MRCSIFIFMLIWTSAAALAEVPGDLLTEMTRDRAAAYGQVLELNGDQQQELTHILLKEAREREQLMIDADPDVSVLAEIRRMEKDRLRAVRDLLDDEQYDVYEYLLEEEADRKASEFDSLQVLLTMDAFRLESQAYFEEEVAPYLVYYHQTFFQPALKEKYIWKINQARRDLQLHYFGVDEYTGDTASVSVDPEEEMREVESQLKQLKKIRRRYRDELDYISVALSPIEREWTKDYIDLVQRHYPDDVFQRIKARTYELHAYGTQYITGQMALILLDPWSPSRFLENRDMLIDLYSEIGY